MFVSDKEQNAVQLSFGEDNLVISNVESNACEALPYIGNKPNQLSSSFVDLNDIKVIVSTLDTEEVTIIYGSESAVAVCTDKMRFVIPVLTDDETEEDNGEN